MSEEILVKQGAPTLAGIKTGSLFPCPCRDESALLDDIRRLNRLLAPKGLCLLPIRFKDEQALFRRRIDGCKRVVEHDDGPCMRERPREREPRLLAARKRSSICKNFCFERERPALDVLPELRFLQERQDIDVPAERNFASVCSSSR